MPFSKPMQNAVLQTVTLSVASMIICHHLFSSAEEKITSNELYYQIQNATEFASNATSSGRIDNSTTTLPTALNETSLLNATTTNGTTSVPENNDEESFYKTTLPRGTFCCIIITILEYYWQIFLERLLPARPRSPHLVSEKSSAEGDDTREEEIVKKWIAHGKIRRASLSWCNTALKWILDITLGQFWINGLDYILESMLKWGKAEHFFSASNLKWELGLRYVFSFLDIRPLASLVAFVVIPVQKRIVFVAGMQLLTYTFVGAFVNTVIPWLARTQFVKDFVDTVSEGIRNGTQASPPSLRNEL